MDKAKHHVLGCEHFHRLSAQLVLEDADEFRDREGVLMGFGFRDDREDLGLDRGFHAYLQESRMVSHAELVTDQFVIRHSY